jgi:membrane protease YdiL (CAAX protease family)
MTLLRSRDIYSTEVARGWLPWGALAPCLALAFVLASQLAGTALIRPFVPLDANFNPLDATALLAFALVPFGLLLLLMLAWVRLVERRPLVNVGLIGARKLRTFLLGHVIGMTSIFAIVALIWLAGGFAYVSFAPAWLVPSSLLIACALQSSVEELLFRGWLLSLLAKKFNVVVAVIVSSALFAFLHFSRGQHWLVTVGTFLFGLFGCG